MITSLYIKKSGRYQLATSEIILDCASKILEPDVIGSSFLTSPELTKNYLRYALKDDAREHFYCVFLNNQHKVLIIERLFTGTLTQSAVYPREVIRSALAHNAAAVIFAHNHPSGISEPSSSDRAITARLKSALDLVDVRVLDHLILGDSIFSFAERGLI